MIFVEINSIVNFNNHDVTCGCIIIKITKSEVINVIRNADFSEKMDHFN